MKIAKFPNGMTFKISDEMAEKIKRVQEAIRKQREHETDGNK